MKSISKIYLVAIIVSVSLASYAHEGQEDEDILIKNLGNLGKVNFSVSCTLDAQKGMNAGVGLLHHMMYAQAELLFAQWIEKEPDCAMMYWGYSMSLFHPLWSDSIKVEALTRGQSALATARKLKSTTREKTYIHAASQYYENGEMVSDQTRTAKWAKAQAIVYQQNPNDIDAAAFFGLSKLAIASKKDSTFSQNKQVGAFLDKFRRQSPTHPGVIHYTIHAYDNTLLAKLAVEAARDYDKIAPDVPHALHMPSHIFTRLGMWTDVISWNIRSATAALNYPTNGSTTMHYVHAMDYLVYGYLQLGEGDKVQQALEQVESKHPHQATFPAAYALSAMPARLALEQRNWQQASQLKTQEPSYIAWQNFPEVEAITDYARGLGAARNNDLKAAKENLKVLDTLYEKTKIKSPDYWATLVDAQRKVVQSWITFSVGEKTQALIELRQAADIEESLDKAPVTPGAVIPARELLADMLFLNGDYSGALTEYKLSLTISPNRLNSVSGVKNALLKMKE